MSGSTTRASGSRGRGRATGPRASGTGPCTPGRTGRSHIKWSILTWATLWQVRIGARPGLHPVSQWEQPRRGVCGWQDHGTRCLQVSRDCYWWFLKFELGQFRYASGDQREGFFRDNILDGQVMAWQLSNIFSFFLKGTSKHRAIVDTTSITSWWWHWIQSQVCFF